jgi:RimK family alpha-L-glutamate ligase
MKITIISSNTDLEEIERIREQAQTEGHTVAIVDFTKFHYSYVDGIISLCPEVPETDTAIVRGMFSAMRSVEPLSQYLKSRGMKVFDNNLFAHKYSINKVFDITKLIFAGIPVPDFYHSRTYEALFGYAREMKYPAVVKTAGTGKGVAIYMVKNQAEMEAALLIRQKDGTKARKIVIQKFVDYKYDLRVLVIGDKMFCMRRIPKTGDFRANFSLGGTVEIFPLTDEIRALAKKAVGAIGLKVAGADILIDKNEKMYVLEVNHTPGFVGMEKATGENIAKIYLDFALANAKKVQ